MIPPKLNEGDGVRVIAPSTSARIVSREIMDAAGLKLGRLGLKVSLGNSINILDDFDSSPVDLRLLDIFDAYVDKDVKAIMTVMGGFNSNQLLKYLDYKLLRSKPKILCGFSDITALQNAIYKKTGMVTYSGPNFSSLGMENGLEYTIKYFKECLLSNAPYGIEPSKEWSDDQWYNDQKNRRFVENEGLLVINAGDADGTVLGGNLRTFNLLQGTEFIPPLKNTILFIEEDYESKPVHFDRDLVSLIQQPGFDEVNGIAIGRFQRGSGMTNELLYKIIKTKKELEDIPVVANLDFGHTTPQITFPIGGRAKMYIAKGAAKVDIIEH